MDTNQPEGQPTTMTVREQIEEIFLLARANRADKWDEYIDRLESLISNAKEEGRKQGIKEIVDFVRINAWHGSRIKWLLEKLASLSSNNPKP